jgi:hypothetical protein
LRNPITGLLGDCAPAASDPVITHPINKVRKVRNWRLTMCCLPYRPGCAPTLSDRYIISAYRELCDLIDIRQLRLHASGIPISAGAEFMV